MQKWKSCTVKIKSGKKGDRSSATTGRQLRSLSQVLRTYSANLAASSAFPAPAGGLIDQSTKTKSPSSEAAQKVGVYCLGISKTLESPSSPEPSGLNKFIYRNGFQMKSGMNLIASFSTRRESQIQTIPSSEQDKKCVCLPSGPGFFLSVLTVAGIH